MTALSTTTVCGLGSLRFNPDVFFSEYDVRNLARKLLSYPATNRYINSPIRFYARGENDLRLEYDYEIMDDDLAMDEFYHIVRRMVADTLMNPGKWHHSHTTRVEFISLS